MRRATYKTIAAASGGTIFYPRSPCGERLQAGGDQAKFGTFLSTLSLRRATCRQAETRPSLVPFLSTLSLRRATGWTLNINGPMAFSIHALLAESDYMCPIISTTTLIFSIHALLAESDGPGPEPPTPGKFSIHALLAESDCVTCCIICDWPDFSIHALLAESDMPMKRLTATGNFFYPRSPCGERPDVGIPNANTDNFLSTLSLRRATLWCYSATT